MQPLALTAEAHSASGIILRWIPQSLAALVWWDSMLAAFAVPHNRLPVVAASALLLGNVMFGAFSLIASGAIGMSEPGTTPELDPIVHGQLRLALLSLLSGVEQVDFKRLREKTGATDGNLGANLAKLEQAKYIAVRKKFIARKPASLYRLTRTGGNALAIYIGALKKLLPGSRL